jgi:O-antigen biosynthesis protein WbqP
VRVIQKLLASLLILLLGPVYVLITLYVITQDGFPILYRSARYSSSLRPFTMWKFRTMKVGAPLQPIENTVNWEEWYIKGGKLIRQLALDELPQIFCILTGDMGFIGPRPAMQSSDHEGWVRLRSENNLLDEKPGITGLAQVRVKTKGSIKNRVRYEMFYRDKKSFVLNVLILIWTFRILVGNKTLASYIK